MSEREPSWAERARTALADARIGTLLTRAMPDPCHSVVATVDGQTGERPTVWLDPFSPLIAALSRCSLATVIVPAPAPFRCLTLDGSLRPCARPGPGGAAYELTVTSARLVGATTRTFPVGEFLGVEADPLREDAATILDHLEKAHGNDLLECIRAHGHDEVTAVIPQGLDRYGLELAAITPDGVGHLRLNFPDGPVHGLDEVGPGLRTVLTCRCREALRPR